MKIILACSFQNSWASAANLKMHIHNPGSSFWTVARKEWWVGDLLFTMRSRGNRLRISIRLNAFFSFRRSFPEARVESFLFCKVQTWLWRVKTCSSSISTLSLEECIGLGLLPAQVGWLFWTISFMGGAKLQGPWSTETVKCRGSEAQGQWSAGAENRG